MFNVAIHEKLVLPVVPAFEKNTFIILMFVFLELTNDGSNLEVGKVVDSLVSQPWVYRLDKFRNLNWFVLRLKIGVKTIKFALSNFRSVPLFS